MGRWVRAFGFELEQSWSDHLVMKPAGGRSSPTLQTFWRLKNVHILSKAGTSIYKIKYLIYDQLRPIPDKNGRTSKEKAQVRASVCPVCALRALIGGQNPLPQPDAPRRDFDQLVVVDEFDGLLEAQHSGWNQPDGLV